MVDFGNFPPPPPDPNATPAATSVTLKPSLLTLSVADLNVQSGTVAVTWCVSPEMLKNLAAQGIRDPQIVIVTASADPKKYHVTKEYRTVASLKDMMAYVEFRSAGPCRIWGFVYSRETKRDVKSQYLGRSDGAFKSDILNSDGSDYRYDWVDWETKQRDTNLADPIEVEVPAGVFAPEPSNFEKLWVNYFFKQKCVDQCAFRRRRLLAYTIQPIPVAGNILLRLLATIVALLIGSRKFSLKPLLHPLTYEMFDAIDACTGGSVFVQKEPSSCHSPFDVLKKYWAVPFMPIVLIVLSGVLFLAWTWHMVFFEVVGVILGLAVSAVALYVAYGLIVDWLEKHQAELNKLPPWYLEQEEMDLIVCSNGTKAKSINDLPARKRTFRLRFQDLKSRVCRPFSV